MAILTGRERARGGWAVGRDKGGGAGRKAERAGGGRRAAGGGCEDAVAGRAHRRPSAGAPPGEGAWEKRWSAGYEGRDKTRG